jgi:Zn-dependent protease
MLSLYQKIAVLALPILFAITVHEAAHGWMAKRLGDRTAEMLGRVTLNPLKHIDLVGTILVPLVVFFMSGFVFGWAKPVPVNYRNLHNPRRDTALVALAGPGANLIMALLWALGILLGVALLESAQWIAVPLVLMGVAGVLFNTVLMALNMLPILPLDGGRVLNSLLPPKLALVYSRLEGFGLIIVILLLATGLLGFVLWPLVGLIISLLPATDIVMQYIPVILGSSRS